LKPEKLGRKPFEEGVLEKNHVGGGAFRQGRKQGKKHIPATTQIPCLFFFIFILFYLILFNFFSLFYFLFLFFIMCFVLNNYWEQRLRAALAMVKKEPHPHLSTRRQGKTHQPKSLW